MENSARQTTRNVIEMIRNKILLVALASIILAAVAGGSAYAMTPEAQMIDNPNNGGGLDASWVTIPSNSYTVAHNQYFTENDKWDYNAHSKSVSTDAIFSYSCPGTYYTINQISYSDAFSQYGQSMSRDTQVQVGSSTGSYTFQESLGFYPHGVGYYYFANPMKPESLTVT